MEIRFIAHALYQLTERGISKKEVEVTVSDPEKVFRQSSGRMCAVRHRDSKYLLVVIYEIRQAQVVVVTAFITSKVNKYL